MKTRSHKENSGRARLCPSQASKRLTRRFDNTNSFNPISLSTSSGQVLLATLSLDASITSAGESFTIALVPGSGDGSMAGGASSYFNVVDSNFNEQSYVSFTSTSGTVNIIASAVPEPASIVCSLMGAAIIGVYALRRSQFCT